MPDFPLFDGQYFESGALDTSVSGGQTLHAGASGAKGSWLEMIGSTAEDSIGIIIFAGQVGTTNRGYAIDIGVGAVSSEIVVIPDLLVTYPTGVPVSSGAYFFPFKIPAGTRIAARCATTSGSELIQFSVTMVYGGFQNDLPAISYAESFGVSGKLGTQIDPGGSANTKGSYTQLIAATGQDYQGINIHFSNGTNSAPSTTDWLIDIAIGAGGSEEILLPNLGCSASSSGQFPLIYMPFPVQIPSGTRIAARCQCTITDATDRLIRVAGWGF